MYITMYRTNKPKIVCFLKFKFPLIIKLNFNGGVNFIKNIKFWLFQKSCELCSEIKFETENVEDLHRKL